MNKHMLSTGFTVPSQRLINSLSVLFVVQMVFAVFLKFSEPKYHPVDSSKPLFACDFAKVSRVVIQERKADGKNTSKVLLQKEGQMWKLPELFNFPASTSNVNQLLTSLKELPKGYAVTTTSGAADRFKVGPDTFQRAVELYSGQQKLSALYLGSSPGYQQTYARMPDSNDIYTVEIPEYQVTGKAGDWIDRSAIALKSADIISVDMGSFQLRKKEQTWTLYSGDKTEPLHKRVAQGVVEAISGLSINSFLGMTPDAAYNLGEPALSCKVTLNSGNTLAYTFSKPTSNNYYVLKRSDKPWYLSIDDWSVNKLKEFTTASLLKSEAEESARDRSAKEKDAKSPEKSETSTDLSGAK